MSHKKKFEQIYVELDVLLDTRLGTIARISEAAATKVLESGYHTRDTDQFDGVDMVAFKELYAKRDTVTLAKSICTGAIKLVKHLVGMLAEQAVTRPYHDGAKIVVNMFPYLLTHEEQVAIGQAISVWMQDLAPIELVRISPEDLTPMHCRNSYSLMLMYEFESWMNIHNTAFEQSRLPEVTLFVPAIYSQKPTEQELVQAVKEAAHPMRALEMLASPIIDLQLIDIKYFSIITG